jgi:hypothetical protein
MSIMRSFASFGRSLAWRPRRKRICLVLPFETKEFERYRGYVRKTSAINSTLHKLWGNGIEFLLWQEDELDSLPAEVRIVLYPAEETIKDSIESRLDTLEARGIRVYREDTTLWLDDPLLEAIRFSSSAPCNVIVRDLQGARLLALFTESEAICRIKLEDEGLELDVISCALLVIDDNHKIRSVEICGNLWKDNRLLFESGSMRCLISTESGDIGTDDLRIDPLGVGRLHLPNHLVHAFVEGKEGYCIVPMTNDGRGPTLLIGPDESCHTIIVSSNDLESHAQQAGR